MGATQEDDVGCWTSRVSRVAGYAVPARLRAAGALLLVAGLAATTTACGGAAEPTARDDSVKVTLDDLPSDLPRDATLLLEPYRHATRFAQLGSAPVTVSWSRISGGRAQPIAGPQGTPALDMPDFTTDAVYPRAVLVVRNATAQDSFNPGTADFMWGADFQLDAHSVADTGPDNGDNLLQRGLWDQSAEYKAEADLRRASCAVHGTEGTLLVRAKMDAEPGKWYRMRCYREAEGLTVTVQELGDSGWGPEIQAQVSGPVGAVTYPPSMPIAIGGKIAAGGALIHSATDQFNGWIANPVIRIGSSS